VITPLTLTLTLIKKEEVDADYPLVIVLNAIKAPPYLDVVIIII
jgi:hypothetical protein